jgi:hypothetical protein
MITVFDTVNLDTIPLQMCFRKHQKCSSGASKMSTFPGEGPPHSLFLGNLV